MKKSNQKFSISISGADKFDSIFKEIAYHFSEISKLQKKINAAKIKIVTS